MYLFKKSIITYTLWKSIVLGGGTKQNKFGHLCLTWYIDINIIIIVLLLIQYKTGIICLVIGITVTIKIIIIRIIIICITIWHVKKCQAQK